MKISVGITDSHPITIKEIKSMLYNHPLIDICFSSEDCENLLMHLETIVPDVLLLDIQITNRVGDDVVNIIKSQYPEIAIIALTHLDQSYFVKNMFMSGVKGYLLKSASANILIQAIENVNRSHKFIDPKLRDQMAYEFLDLNHERSKPILTRREHEVLELIINKSKILAISKELSLDVNTIENHKANLFFKFRVKNTTELIWKSLQLGYVF